MNRPTERFGMGETDTDRLRRIETRLIRFAEELGVDLDVDPNWLSVDDASRTIYISNLGRSLLVINKTAKKLGATQKGKAYEIIHKGYLAGTIVIH